MTIHDFQREAERHLAAMLGPAAAFRDGQWEAIQELVQGRGRLLLVQRTGWGKSLVYFLATRLLRDRGAGPTLLVSPLLALMRNQTAMAARIGVRAETINSSNVGEWRRIEEELRAGRVDVLLISPERLANHRFTERVLAMFAAKAGLFVVDEAHCISDWGHDFRPDYRRIVQTLGRLPSNVPILATTATANSRVVEDVVGQLGEHVRAIRGPLDRPSLRLQTLSIPDQAGRLAWLADHVPRLPGSGIIYCLTIPDVKRVADFLRNNGIQARAYWGGLENESRLDAEAALVANEIKALVATTALGMGYDKPDLGFVIHYQSPGSLVAYYQQVGRAGRALDEAYGVMMVGAEDEEIHDHFIHTAFPSADDMRAILAALEASPEPMSVGMLAASLNIARSRLDHAVKTLELEGAVTRADSRYARSQQPWAADEARREKVTAIRRAERARVLEYATAGRCLMQFLVRELDGEMLEPCGRCAVCGGDLFAAKTRGSLRKDATHFLKSQAEPIAVRKRWPTSRDGSIRPIPEEHRLCEGFALSVYGDAGWGELVARSKYRDGFFGGDLVGAAAEFIQRRWLPDPPPEWVAYVPSRTRAELVADFAARLARRLGLPVVAAVERSGAHAAQKEMENSYLQAANAWRAYAVAPPIPAGPCLLIDDIVDSGWTLTVIGVKLRRAGAGPVHPFALATAAKRG